MTNRIAEARKAKGYSLVKLAELVGLSDGAISRYETGKREPKLNTWKKLADALGVSVPYLQGAETPETYLNDVLAVLAELKERTDPESYNYKALHYFDDEQERAICLQLIRSLQDNEFLRQFGVVTGMLPMQLTNAFSEAYQKAVMSNQNLFRLVYNELTELRSTVTEYGTIYDNLYGGDKYGDGGLWPVLSASPVTQEGSDAVINLLDAAINKLDGMEKTVKDGPSGFNLCVSQAHLNEEATPVYCTHLTNVQDEHFITDNVKSASKDVSTDELISVLQDFEQDFEQDVKRNAHNLK